MSEKDEEKRKSKEMTNRGTKFLDFLERYKPDYCPVCEEHGPISFDYEIGGELHWECMMHGCEFQKGKIEKRVAFFKDVIVTIEVYVEEKEPN